jgi:hypothetical protein
MGLREWPPGIEFENLSLDQFKLEDAASAVKIRLDCTLRHLDSRWPLYPQFYRQNAFGYSAQVVIVGTVRAASQPIDFAHSGLAKSGEVFGARARDFILLPVLPASPDRN